jgi:hypothetical protein
VIVTLPARRNAAWSALFALRAMTCLLAIAGCERTQQPGPGPKPISSQMTAPPTSGASGSQGAARP